MASSWTGPVLAVFALWLAVGTACLPLLAWSRLRRPIARWPTERLGLNYALLSGAFVLGHAFTFFAGIVATGGLRGTEAVWWTLVVAVGYPFGLWMAIGSVAIGTGRWAGPETTVTHVAVVGVAAAWYAAVVVLLAAITFFVLFVLYFPG